MPTNGIPMITTENAVECQAKSVISRMKNKARKAEIADFINSKSVTEILEDYNINMKLTAQDKKDIGVYLYKELISAEQKHSHRMEQALFQKRLKSGDIDVERAIADISDKKKVWSFADLVNGELLTSVDTHKLLELFEQNKNEQPNPDEQNRLLMVWRLVNGKA
ncbi:hypothetical protein AB6E53_06735 [Vibrio breoganii]